MDTGFVIGELSEGDREGEVEWTIPDFFSYTEKDDWYCSSTFNVLNSDWFLSIHPNGQTKQNSVGYITLQLQRGGDRTSPKTVDFTLGVKNVDGTVDAKADFVWIFDKARYSWGTCKFLERSELLQRRSELAPSDNLTVTCTLRVDDNFISAARLDTLSDNFKDLFVSKTGCDVTVKVKHEEFFVHQCILQARSPVFATMFQADMKENNTGFINIEDCDPEPFREFLLFLYSGKIENISSNVFELYYIAHKYDVVELKKACLLDMMKNLSLENVCDAVLLADLYKEPGLKMKTQQFFNENFKEIFFTSQWESLLQKRHSVANELLQNMAQN